MSSLLAKWIDTINERMGCEFALGGARHLYLECAGGRRVGVEMLEDDTAYVIYSPVGLLSDPAELPRVLVAMRLNLYQQATAGGVIGLDTSVGIFMYSLTCPTQGSSAVVLAKQLDRFIAHSDWLQRELEQAAAPEGRFDYELAMMKQSHGLLEPSEVEKYERGERLDDPDSATLDMMRV